MITCVSVDCFGHREQWELDDDQASNWMDDLLGRGTWKFEVIDGMISGEVYMWDEHLDKEPSRARVSFTGEFGPCMDALVKFIVSDEYRLDIEYWVNRFRLMATMERIKRGIEA